MAIIIQNSKINRFDWSKSYARDFVCFCYRARSIRTSVMRYILTAKLRGGMTHSHELIGFVWGET